MNQKSLGQRFVGKGKSQTRSLGTCRIPSPALGALYAFTALFLWAGTGTGCEGNGHLTILMDMPKDGRFAPDVHSAAQFRLTAVRQNGDREDVFGVWPVSVRNLDIGTIQPGPMDYLELVGYAADGHVVAYGRSLVSNVPEAQDGEIHMALRRPVTYVAGAKYVLRIDTSRFDESQFLPTIQVTDQPTAGPTQSVATTPDGRYVLAGATAPASQVVVMPTGSTDSNDMIRSVNWPAGISITDLAVSPDNRWLVVAATDDQGGLIYRFSLENVVHNGLNPNNTGPKATIPGKPAKIRFTSLPDGSLAAVVLSGALDVNTSCDQHTTPSTYTVVSLNPSNEQAITVPLKRVASDIEATTDPPIVYIVYPCQDSNNEPVGMAGLEPTTGQVIRARLTIPDARSITKTSDAFVVGEVNANESPNKTFLQFGLHQITGEWGHVDQVQIPMPPIDIQIGSSGTGPKLYLSVPATKVVPYFIQGTPAGQRISVLLQAFFKSEPVQISGLSIQAFNVQAFFYVTADLAASQVSSTLLTKCVFLNPSTGKEFTPTNPNLTCVGNRPVNESGDPLDDFQPTDLAHVYEVP